MFGSVEKVAQELLKCPLDNYHMASVELLSCNQLLKDAMNEMEEALNSEIDPTEPEDIDDEIWEMDDLALTAEQKKVVPPCIILIKASGGALVQISRVLKKQSPSKEGRKENRNEN